MNQTWLGRGGGNMDQTWLGRSRGNMDQTWLGRSRSDMDQTWLERGYRSRCNITVTTWTITSTTRRSARCSRELATHL